MKEKDILAKYLILFSKKKFNLNQYATVTSNGISVTAFACAAALINAGTTFTYNGVTLTVTKMGLCTTDNCNAATTSSYTLMSTSGANGFQSKGKDLMPVLIVTLALFIFS